MPLLTDRPHLPVDELLPDLLQHLQHSPNLVLLAPPGSGKTTRVPPALVASPLLKWGSCVVLEPRRVAARAAARWVAAEQGMSLGTSVGYQVRFDRCGGPQTRLWYVTEGILTARLQSDPFLDGVGVVVLDEFHERSLDLDLALALLREVQREVRPELRIVVMSATLAPGPVAEYLQAPVIESAGQSHPVEIRYRERIDHSPLPLKVAGAVKEAWPRRPGGSGDVLVFLPGVGDISRTGRELAPWAAERDVEVLPLHGNLPPREQDRALRPGSRARVVLATNVAESSVTVGGVNTVVDCGLAKVLRSDPGRGVDHLELEPISLANADQRSGRAGRTGPGLALRLWTLHEEQGMRPRQAPEVRRLDLALVVLQILGWGHTDPNSFPWFEAPQPERLDAALALLRQLGAVDASGRLTPDGEHLRRLPLHPRLGRLAVHAARQGLARQGALLAATLAEGDILAHPGSGDATRGTSSDLLLRLELLESLPAEAPADPVLRRSGLVPAAVHTVLRSAAQIQRSISRSSPKDTPGADHDVEVVLLQALLRAYPDRVGRRVGDGMYQLVGGRRARLAPRSAVRDAEFLVAPRLRGGQRGSFSHDHIEWASRIEPEWLVDLQDLGHLSEVRLDTQRGRVVRCETTTYLGLPLAERERPPDPEQAAALLVEYLAADPLGLLTPSREVLGWIARCRFLREHRPELDLPGWDRADWESILRAPAAAAAGSLDRLRRADLLPHLKGLLTWEQLRSLDRDAPERIEVASGSRLRVDYSPAEQHGGRPVLAVKIQELFGCREGPRVAGGRVPLLLHLLGPHGRPLQVTDDLASFWERGYPEVRKEVRGRYPKHRWPEDPLTAEPSRSSTGRRQRGAAS